MSRTNERAGFDEPMHRIVLLESDLDKVDASHVALTAEIKALRQVLTGILVSLATASVLLAINLAVQIS